MHTYTHINYYYFSLFGFIISEDGQQLRATYRAVRTMKLRTSGTPT